MSRRNEKFEKFSALQSERRSKHIYPHRLSRKGYATFTEEIKDVYIQSKKEGNLQSEDGDDDLLSVALNKSQHSGRVRCIGAGVTPSRFFRSVRGSTQTTESTSQEQLNEYKKKMEEYDGKIHVLDKFIYELVNRIGKLEANTVDKCKSSEGCGSFSVMKALVEEEHDEDVALVERSTHLQGKKVALLLGSTKNIVGYGTVVPYGDVLHGVPMPEDCLRVSIDEVVDENAKLPFRVSDEIESVGSA